MLSVTDGVEPKAIKIEGDDKYGKFEIGPLESGFGTTIGNSLRRILLSHMPGAAVTAIQIDGVVHEFSSIPHVKEDVTELILNIKQLRLRCHVDVPVTIILDVMGPKEVRAGDIQTGSEVEIVNPDLYLCSVGENGRLRMEMTVEKGKGYVLAEANKKEGQPLGTIPIDSIFSPVRKANFEVEKVRVGQRTDYEKLYLEVLTDGAMTPEDAVTYAATMLAERLSVLTGFSVKPVQKMEAGKPSARLYDIPIEELDLSVRAFNCLKSHNITSIGMLLDMKESELMALRNFGNKSLQEVKDKLVEKGFVSPEMKDKLFKE